MIKALCITKDAAKPELRQAVGTAWYAGLHGLLANFCQPELNPPFSVGTEGKTIKNPGQGTPYTVLLGVLNALHYLRCLRNPINFSLGQ